MASTYSNLKIQLMATGENSGTWGNVTNANLGTAIEQALVETATVTFASATVTLSLTDTNAAQDARALRLNLTGTSGGPQDLVVPAIQKPYIVNNGTADTITVKVSGQTGIAVPASKSMLLYNNGTDVGLAFNRVVADLVGDGSAITGVNASNVSTGTLSNDRTTASSSNGASTIIARDASGNFSSNYITANRFQFDSTDYLSFSNNAYIDVYVNNSNEFRFEADGDFHADGDVVAYSGTVSDQRLKENIETVEDSINKIKQIRGVTFVRKQNGQRAAGVVAQEVEKVLPEAVREKILELQTGDSETLYKVVEYDALHALLIEAVKELSARVEALEAK